MKDTDRAQFVTALQGVYALYRVEFSPAVAAIWFSALQTYDLAAVTDALGRHCVNPDTGQFLPKPADVVRMMEGSTTDSAFAAWAKVTRAVAAVGMYATVVFDDPLVHRVIADMGGWPHLCQRKADEWQFVEKEFCNRYRGFKVARAQPPYPRKLAGVFDRDNLPRGFAQQPPVLVGNRDRAHAVMVGGTAQPLLEITRLEDSA